MSLISNLAGLAGAPYRPLQPPHTAAPRFTSGPYGAQLRPSLMASQRKAYSDCLSLGFLIGRPDVDGNGWRELDHPAYARQPVELAPRNLTQLAISRPVLFDIFDCPPVHLLGLFNADNELEAFGALRGYCSRVRPASRFEFAAFQILVNKIRA